MNKRKIMDNIFWMGVIDWNRRLFDGMIPIPDGTSYNAYLIEGSEKTALIDTVESEWSETLMKQLSNVKKIDFVISNHAEQDHSGSIPNVLEKYPESILICSLKAKDLLTAHLKIDAERIQTVEDGEVLSLGNWTLKFIYTPWVHWPETMSTYLQEEKILFSCDFFGSHMATTELFAGNNQQISDAAKRYYAEIMMPYRKIVQKNLDIVKNFDIKYIAPSHGPIYDEPEFIISKYEDWSSDNVKNLVVIPYISMHGSTKEMVEYLASALADKDIRYEIFELNVSDIGKLAMALVDAATVVIGTPTVNVGPHPKAVYVASVMSVLKPKLKYAAVIGSFGWTAHAAQNICDIISNLKLEMLGNVSVKGVPTASTYKELDALADIIAGKHYSLMSK
ncbi:MAG TPA: MBL fold hydrolase [Lentisphaeria bacterium]|nr:MAG: MBL fold hydrolase [Lentisphaerae bacterium GWF2_38_69]HBM17325.1 MBL fold hydrolase [Lentisphaeria bacterium]